MKARVKATGEIVDVVKDGPFYNVIDGYERYYEHELDFNDTIDYWTRLEHQAAIAAMQAQMAPDCIDSPEGVACTAYAYAHALVEKMKEEKK